MKFSEVVGQQNVCAKLASMAASGKIPHALMFLGPEGNGNLAIALATAQYIQCENRTENDSCGVCSSCVKNQKFIHPDLHFTFPVIKPESKKSPPVSADYIVEWRSALQQNAYMSYNGWMQTIGAENKQGNITAEECRQIIHQLSLKTYESGYKIQIVWLAEFLALTGNILLKSLEEPPPNTIFILLAENSELILSTILSRVQLIKISQIDDEEIKLALQKRFEMDDAAAKRIARIADGNFSAALGMADGEEDANDKTLRNWLLYCFNLKQKPSSDNSKNLLDWIEEFSKTGRENQKIFLKYALFFLRECAMISLLGNSEKLDGEELSFATKFSKILQTEQLETLSKIFNRMYYHIERNANPKILFMSNSFKIASVFKNEEVLVD
jgi:DNA polymerase-3 subunit delta'